MQAVKLEEVGSSTVKDTIVFGIKKLITETTSIKFWLMCFCCVGITMKWIDPTLGLGTSLIIIGVREVPIDALVAKITGGIGK